MTDPDVTQGLGAAESTPSSATVDPEEAGPDGLAPDGTGETATPPGEGAATAGDATTAATAESGAAVPAPPDVQRQRRRRRKLALLTLLASLVGVFALFAGWYLLYRKPIAEVLPAIGQEALPHYVFSIYGVKQPTGVAVSASGDRIYATETDGQRLVRIFDQNGNQVGVAQPPATTGTYHVPVYLALDPLNGDLYVSDRPTGSIYVYSKDGLYRRTFNPGSSLVGWEPLGLAFDSQGNFYVTDVSGPFNRVHEFSHDGKLIRSIGDETMFSFPNGVAVDRTGNLYATDSDHGRVLVFDAANRQRSTISRGVNTGELGLPRGIAIDDANRLYVVDTTANEVQVYHALGPNDRRPMYVGGFGGEGVQDGDFEFPFGVAVDARGRVYVADWNNNRVQVWSY